MAISQTQTISDSVLVTNHFEKLKHFGNLRATGWCIEYVSVLPQGRSMEIPREVAVSGAFQNHANLIYETINEPHPVTTRNMCTTGLRFI